MSYQNLKEEACGPSEPITESYVFPHFEVDPSLGAFFRIVSHHFTAAGRANVSRGGHVPPRLFHPASFQRVVSAWQDPIEF